MSNCASSQTCSQGRVMESILDLQCIFSKIPTIMIYIYATMHITAKNVCYIVLKHIFCVLWKISCHTKYTTIGSNKLWNENWYNGPIWWYICFLIKYSSLGIGLKVVFKTWYHAPCIPTHKLFVVSMIFPISLIQGKILTTTRNKPFFKIQTLRGTDDWLNTSCWCIHMVWYEQ